MKAPNSTLTRSTKPMKRSAFLGRGKPMRSSRPKSTPIRKSARGEDCTISLPTVCNRDSETVVLCHSNLLKDGKGMGLKAPDERAAYGCSSCHDVVDGRRPLPVGWTMDMVLERFEAAIFKTHNKLRAKGLLKEGGAIER